MRRDQQRDRAVGAAGPFRPGEQQQVVGDRPERDQVLLARQVVGVALPRDRTAQVGAGAGGRLGQRERDLDLARDDGSTNRSRCSGVAWESSGRQIPLETWTIIRSDACDIANSSSSGRYWVNGTPRPP